MFERFFMPAQQFNESTHATSHVMFNASVSWLMASAASRFFSESFGCNERWYEDWRDQVIVVMNVSPFLVQVGA